MEKSNEKEIIIEKITKIVEPYVDNMQLSLVDVEYLQDGGYWYVRIFVENLNGELDIEDCKKLSHNIEEQIDEIVDKKYFLEVSSPGIERPLKKLEDFIRFKGEKVTLNLKHKNKELNNKKQFKAKIIDVIKDEAKIIFEIDKNNIEIDLKEIRKTNILFEFGDF